MLKSPVAAGLVTALMVPILSLAQDGHLDLLTEFWQTESLDRQQEIGNQLIDRAGNTETLYQWLQSGPAFSDDAPYGYQERSRVDADGQEFPYAIVIPESYDPSVSHAVEFMLHGGVTRPFPALPDSMWSRYLEVLPPGDRIAIIPTSWNEAFWWFPNQSENVREILRAVKREYNVDDNRVILTGASDGGTGTFFFAYKQATEWVAFLPYIGHPGVMQNSAGVINHELFPENLVGKPLYIVNGDRDRRYPIPSIMPYINGMREAGADYEFRVMRGAGHDFTWIPREENAIESFKQSVERDPLPDSIQWLSDSSDQYNRNHWIIIDALSQEGAVGVLKAEREGNTINVTTRGIETFTLLLSPDEVDFNNAIQVSINGELRFDDRLEQSSTTLLKWAAHDLDRTMLFTAELQLQAGD